MTGGLSLGRKVYAHVETMRPYTVLWSGLVGLVGACVAFGDVPSLRVAVLAFVIPILGWIAGLYLSDFQDRKLDAIEKPHRPIPSGRISPGEILVVGGVYAVVGLVLSVVFLTVYNVVIVFVVAVLVLSYARFAKSRGLFGNLNRGIIMAIAYLFGVLSVTTQPWTLPWSVWVLAVVFFLHDTSSNIVGAIRDIEGDRAGHYETVPVKYGVRAALWVSLVLTVSYLVLVVVAVLFLPMVRYPLYFFVAFGVGLVILVVLYLRMLVFVRGADRRKALQAHELFVMERTVLSGALLLGVIAASWVALCIVLLALAVTGVSQVLLRARHEFAKVG